ncbi:MAG TPA: MAPEG family protein [Rhodopila sp.]
MTIAELCLLGSVILTIVSIMPAKLSGRGDYDNGSPRDPRFFTPGLRTRSLGAHQNGFEAFPLFAAAVILAEMRAVPQGTVDLLAVTFVVIRVVYVVLYLGDRPSLRSMVWWVGFVCNLAIFFSPVWVKM